MKTTFPNFTKSLIFSLSVTTSLSPLLSSSVENDKHEIARKTAEQSKITAVEIYFDVIKPFLGPVHVGDNITDPNAREVLRTQRATLSGNRLKSCFSDAQKCNTFTRQQIKGFNTLLRRHRLRYLAIKENNPQTFLNLFFTANRGKLESVLDNIEKFPIFKDKGGSKKYYAMYLLELGLVSFTEVALEPENWAELKRDQVPDIQAYLKVIAEDKSHQEHIKAIEAHRAIANLGEDGNFLVNHVKDVISHLSHLDPGSDSQVSRQIRIMIRTLENSLHQSPRVDEVRAHKVLNALDQLVTGLGIDKHMMKSARFRMHLLTACTQNHIDSPDKLKELKDAIDSHKKTFAENYDIDIVEDELCSSLIEGHLHTKDQINDFFTVMKWMKDTKLEGADFEVRTAFEDRSSKDNENIAPYLRPVYFTQVMSAFARGHIHTKDRVELFFQMIDENMDDLFPKYTNFRVHAPTSSISDLINDGEAAQFITGLAQAGIYSTDHAHVAIQLFIECYRHQVYDFGLAYKPKVKILEYIYTHRLTKDQLLSFINDIRDNKDVLFSEDRSDRLSIIDLLLRGEIFSTEQIKEVARRVSSSDKYQFAPTIIYDYVNDETR